ncbi:MAG: Xaa-Pro peptidase family protein [Candidatus Micrarchaeota archaeon]
MVFDFASRLKKLQKSLGKSKADCVVFGGFSNVDSNAYYYSGDLSAPNVLVVTPDYAAIFSSAGGFDFFDEGFSLKDFRKNLFILLKKLKAKRIGVDEYSDSARIAFKLMQQKYVVKPVAEVLSEQRLLKDPSEMRLLEKAQNTTKECVSSVRSQGFEGKTENKIAGMVEFAAREKGVAADAFPPIVACNENAAIPHWIPSQKKFCRNDLLLIDAGVRCERYCGDFTHTFYDGSDKQLKDAVEAVEESKKAAVKKAKPGVTGKALSCLALLVLKEYGFEKSSFSQAGLSLGHFVGLDAHDGAKRWNDAVFKNGMAFTIEPGIYVPGKFGVRFEDVVLLK